jgi:hypothetical protein
MAAAAAAAAGSGSNACICVALQVTTVQPICLELGSTTSKVGT